MDKLDALNALPTDRGNRQLNTLAAFALAVLGLRQAMAIGRDHRGHALVRQLEAETPQRLRRRIS